MMKPVLLFVCALFVAAGKTAIVNAHNILRSTLAKGQYNARGDIRRAATNMKLIGWDDDLAVQAYRSIMNCPANIARPANTGCNIRVVDASGTQVADDYAKQAVAAWEQEFQDKGWPLNNTVTSQADLSAKGLAEATQMAFSLTGAVGCGVQKCGTKVATVCYYKYPLLDNYPVYQMGPVCSRCPDFHVCQQATGLCAYQNTG